MDAAALARARAYRCPLSGAVAGDVLDRALAGDLASAERALGLERSMSAGDPAAASAYGEALRHAPVQWRTDPRAMSAPVAALGDIVKRAAHRPRRDPAAARVNLVVRVHPGTRAAIDAEARRSGESAGQVVDRIARALVSGG